MSDVYTTILSFQKDKEEGRIKLFYSDGSSFEVSFDEEVTKELVSPATPPFYKVASGPGPVTCDEGSLPVFYIDLGEYETEDRKGREFAKLVWISERGEWVAVKDGNCDRKEFKEKGDYKGLFKISEPLAKCIWDGYYLPEDITIGVDRTRTTSHEEFIKMALQYAER